MLAVPVYNMDGKQTGEKQIDPAVLGGEVRHALVKQAIVAFLDHQRQFSARTKGRSQVEGSTRKLYRQKGTGHARMGSIRTPVRKGGGRTFAKRTARPHKGLSRKMRRIARDSAILAKLQASDVLIVENLACQQPKTKAVASLLSSLGADRGCLLAIHEFDRNVYLSSRNIARTDIRLFDDLNAYEVLRRRKLIFSSEAFDKLATREPVARVKETEAAAAGDS